MLGLLDIGGLRLVEVWKSWIEQAWGVSSIPVGAGSVGVEKASQCRGV